MRSKAYLSDNNLSSLLKLLVRARVWVVEEAMGAKALALPSCRLLLVSGDASYELRCCSRPICVVMVVSFGGWLRPRGGPFGSTALVLADMDLRSPTSTACQRPLPAWWFRQIGRAHV